MRVSPSLWCAVAVSLLSPVAEAHIGLSAPGPIIANTTQELSFTVGHGCSGADTVRVEIRIPTGVGGVRPLDTPFGKAVVKKNASGVITSVVWTKPAEDVLPEDTQLYKFTLRAKLPDTPFAPLFFPTVQTCRSAAGVATTVEWVGEDTGHGHGLAAEAASPAPYAFLLPARAPGWNKYTVPTHVHDLSVFHDAQIVWAGNAVYSPNTSIQGLIAQEQNTQPLSEIHPGTEIWIKY